MVTEGNRPVIGAKWRGKRRETVREHTHTPKRGENTIEKRRRSKQ